MPSFRIISLALLLSGCSLVDQATFDPALRPVAKLTPPPPAPMVQPNGALLTIRLTGAAPDYEDSLASAVRQALAVKPDITFQVVSMVPQQGDTVPTWDQAQRVTVWGRRIAEQIERDGVDQGQIELGLRATPGLDHGEIRVYVQ